MSSPDAAAPVNSRAWWEEFFASQWDTNNGRAQTTCFMQRLVENLPVPEREFLASHQGTILDWGCAFGDGVDVLAKAFPRCRAVGMDFAQRAIFEARRSFPHYDFRHTDNGEIGEHFDVIIVSNCLEHFTEPLPLMRQHLRSCRNFYAVLVPYRETPPHPYHASQFGEESFPEQLDGFTRIAAVVVDCQPPYFPGQQLLVIYGSHPYLQERHKAAQRVSEQQKWDNYYASLPPQEIDDAMQAFGEDLAERLRELLPPDNRVLEAGCGGGWQSLVLARTGKLRLSLMDFSPQALRYAEQSFARQNLSADFLCEDLFAPGKPEYDLVFNAGVLEHYTFDQQVALLRGMASRSRKYVLVLVPNRMCYWYWLWRMQSCSRGQWPFGKEMPMANLSNAFEAAGLRLLGHWFGGVQWSEFFIKSLAGIDDRLREEILTIHRSPVIPVKQRAYLVAALGCKGEATQVPSCWAKEGDHEEFATNQLTASIADALAAMVGSQHRCQGLETTLTEKEQQLATREQQLAIQRETSVSLQQELQQRLCELAQLRSDLADKSQAAAELTALKRSRGYRLLPALWRMRRWLAPPGSRRARLAQTGWHALRDVANFRPQRAAGSALSAARRQLKRIGGRLVPVGTARGEWLRTAVHRARRMRHRTAGDSSLDLQQILEQTGDRKGIVVYPPFIDWTWMRQRPQQLMTHFARAGYLSLFCSPQRRTDSFRGYVRVAERLYLCDALKPLYDLSHVVLLVNWPHHWETIKRFRSPSVVYDYLDDLGVSAEGGVPDRRKVELHRKLVTKSEIVLATARRLHEEVRVLRPDALYCPNGVDYEHFRPSPPRPPPPDIADLVGDGRPIIGYYGVLARWFDYDLVAHAASARRDCTFLLIGPDFDGALAAHQLTRLTNVRWIGEKKYEELPAYLAHFTVATIPFLVNDVTKATSPVKLFEYMAGAKPIVTTDLPECRQHSCVLVARDPAEYVAMLDEAIQRGKQQSNCRLLDEVARDNTWEARIRQIVAQLDSLSMREQLRSA